MSCAYNRLYIQFKFRSRELSYAKTVHGGPLRVPTLCLSLQSQGNFHYGRNPLKKKKKKKEQEKN